ncbi:MAG: hypothetical protein A2512_11725 [Deltaproteobacteria bacterium RIFOXYD12_FULL_56_24]|nr:MAG: hypothetical protein A2512_11725 [Deltaproteobacteria bacterium RIFOXYD12_FULL_56_24]
MAKHIYNPPKNFQAKSRHLLQQQLEFFLRKNQEMTIFRGDNGGMPTATFNNGNLTDKTSTLKHGNQNEFTREYRLHLDGKFPLDQKPHKIAGVPTFEYNFPLLPLSELKIGKQHAHLFGR